MKTMTKIITCLLCIGLIMAGCTKDKAEELDDRLKVIESQLDFTAAGGTGKIVLEQAGLTVSSNAEWCTASVSENTVNVTVAQHAELPDRTAVVTVRSGNKSVNVPITQSGTRFIIDDTEIAAPFTACTIDRLILSDLPLDINIEPESDWIHISIVADTLRLVIDENPDATSRTANISISSGVILRTIVLTQALKPTVNALFINQNWYFAYSGLGAYPQLYWDYTKANGLDAQGEVLTYAYLGTNEERYGFHFSSYESGNWPGGMVYNYQLIGDDKVKLTLTSSRVGYGAYYYSVVLFNYLINPIGTSTGRTFTVSTNNISAPEWILLTDDNQAGNTIKLFPTLITYPYDH
ncbi:MAG: hypothetical protein LBC98_06180 [Prevotellaceae bacterium]|jgi:hypothetical protein|nr:hypothetical protein [Prevotellaceae bacterium]